MHSIENPFIRIELSDNGALALRDLKHGTVWKAEKPFYFGYGNFYSYDLWAHCRHRTDADKTRLHVHFDQFGWWAGFPEHTYHKPDPGPALEFDFTIELQEDEIQFTIGEIEGIDEEVCTVEFPAGMLNRKNSEPGGVLLPCGYGGLYRFPRHDTFKVEYRYFYDYNCIPGYGSFSEVNSGIGVRIQDPCDQKTYFEVSNRKDGEASCGTVFEYNRRFANYPRRFRWKILPPGSSYNEMAKWYRSTLIREGKFVTLEEKIRRNPEIEKLVGAVVWKFNVYSQKVLPPGVKRDYSLGAASADVAAVEHFPNNRSAYEFFDSAKAAGFDRVTVYNTGWNFMGYDVGYPTRLPPNPERGTPEEFTAAAQYARSLSDGFVYSIHDNYHDCYPSCPEEYRHNVQRTAEGGLRKGGIWRGGRAELMCTKQSMLYARRDVPQIVKMLGRGSLYVDVFGTMALEECWSEDHPQSRRDDLRSRREILQYMVDQFGGVTTESAPTEALADIVTMGAFCSFFPTLPMPASAEQPVAVPFWQLVFHDSVLGTTGCLKLDVKDYYPMLALYGLLPRSLEEESLRLSRELRSAYKAEMVRHQFVTPVKDRYHAVARTDFSDGTTVWANLTDEVYEANGISLAPHSFKIVHP